jgi:predicted O-methyltransferase YrrM
MLTGWEEGAFLATFAARVGARKVLEIGTFTGFSLICLADGTAKRERAPVAEKATQNKSRIDAIEINDELKYIIDEAVTRAGYSSCTTIYYGDAKAIIPTLNGSEQYDLVFIDANKREYLHYYNLVFPLVRPKGYIIADNVLWYGKAAAADNQQKPDAKTLGIREFNALIESDTRIEKELISIRDGLYIIQKL